MGELDNLPLLVKIAFGGMLAVIFAVRYFGVVQGERSSPAKSHASAQVAAVIVDPTALNRLTDEAEKMTDMIERLIEVGEKMARSEEHMAIELDRIREEMRIQREVERRRGG